MNIQLSFRDMAFYCGIPYDLYDQYPDEWDKVIKTMTSKICNSDSVDYLIRMQKMIFKRSWVHFVASNDYNSDKKVIIIYSGGSGGNFLRNCLYFNDSCVDLLVFEGLREKRIRLTYFLSNRSG